MKYHYKPVKVVRIRITKKWAVAFLFLILGIAFSFYLYQVLKPIKVVNLFIPETNKTLSLEFEHDVRLAKKIPLYPNEQAINSLIFNPKVKNIFLVFKFTDSPEDNKLLAKQAVEIAFKLSLVLMAKGNKVRTVHSFEELVNASQMGFLTIFTMNITSYEGLSVDEKNPTIALVPPILADENAVRVEDYVVFVKGKNRENFELATIRFLTAALGIKI